MRFELRQQFLLLQLQRHPSLIFAETPVAGMPPATGVTSYCRYMRAAPGDSAVHAKIAV